MSSTFQTGARIFPCAKCGEMIYSDSATCRFCSAPVDRYAAEAAADNQKKVNNAVNMAKWIRNAAGAMWAFVGLGLVFGILSLAAIAWGTENRGFRLRQSQAEPANCAAARAAREFHSNPYCHRTDGVVTDRG